MRVGAPTGRRGRAGARRGEPLGAGVRPPRSHSRGVAGKPAGELVARVELAPYGADKLAPAEEQIELPKKTAIAVAAGLFVPLGSAHHYSEHVVLGSTLSVGCIVWLVAGMVALPGAFTGWAVLVAIDVLLGPSALRRRNRGAIWSPSRQLTVGVVAIVMTNLAVLLSG